MNIVESAIKKVGKKEDEFAFLMGVTPTTVRRWLREETNPSGSSLVLLTLLNDSKTFQSEFIIGAASALTLVNPSSGKIRKLDDWGSGEWHAARGNRKHLGIDLTATKKQSIVAPTSGQIRLGFPYEDGEGGASSSNPFRYVSIKDRDVVTRVFYVSPVVKNGDLVKAGEKIGEYQSLQKRYPKITDHVHLELIINGKHENPEKYLDL